MKVKLRCATVKKSSPSRFEVILIQEGLGNFGNAFYYTANAIRSGVAAFNGKKIMMNHAGEFEEHDRPERTIQEAVGHYENLKAVPIDGRMVLKGEAVIAAGASFDEARERMQHAIEYAKEFTDQDFIGLSINGEGDAEESNLDDVLKDAPEPCKAKLLEAKEMGIETVWVTNRIMTAKSCDLVTEAGAGGKILRMIESAKEKKSMAKKIKKPVAKESKKTKEADPAKDPAHDDKEKDQELIKSMLDKHVGKDKHDGDDTETMHQAVQAYKQMGMDHEAAHEAAAKHVQASKLMSQSESEESEETETEAEGEESEAEGEESETETEGEDADGDDDGDEAPAKKKKAAPAPSLEKKESAANLSVKLVKTMAENAALKEKLAKNDLEKHVEKKLSESKIPKKITNEIREAAKDVKTAAEFDRIFKFFEKALTAARAETGVGFEDTFANLEREAPSDESGSDEISFADSVDED